MDENRLTCLSGETVDAAVSDTVVLATWEFDSPLGHSIEKKPWWWNGIHSRFKIDRLARGGLNPSQGTFGPVVQG